MVTTTFVSSSNQAAPQTSLLFESPSTKLFVNNQEFGTGTLHVTESNVVWNNRLTTGNQVRRISLLYPTISFHGIQRVPSAALYMVINYELRSLLPQLSPQLSHDDNEDEEYDPEEQPITELRFVPDNENELNALHSALSKGQSLHPDPADEVYPEEDRLEDIFAEEPEEDAAAAFGIRHLSLDNNSTPDYMDYNSDDDEDRNR